jgi:hypothetical protein
MEKNNLNIKFGKEYFKSIKINSTIKNNLKDILEIGKKIYLKKILNLIEDNKNFKSI